MFDVCILAQLESLLQVVDVGNFLGFQADEASLKKLRHLTAEINERVLHPITVSLYPNLLCLAPYSEVSDVSLYYRAKILHLRSNTVEVSLCSQTLQLSGQHVVLPLSFLITYPLYFSPV